MHAGELPVDEDLVRRLLGEQFPDLAERPLRLLRTTGTVNAVVRLGDDAYVRLPRKPHWAADLEREWRWLPVIAAHVDLAVPVPLRLGRPTEAFPYPWAVFGWLPGDPYATGLVADEAAAAYDLARFVTDLRTVPTDDAPAGGRRPLAELDEQTRQAIDQAGDLVDRHRLRRAWDAALEAPVWDGRRVWIHSDLLQPNLLVHEHRLSAVIDFGAAGAGDPAGDVIAAWAVFGARGRDAYREALAVDDGTWERARGWLLHQAVMIIPYYRDTNPGFVTWARATLDRL